MDEPAPTQLRLPPSPRSPRLAREWADRFLRESGHLELAAPAALVVSELVTNAIVHTDSGATLRLRVRAGNPPVVRVEVEDCAPDALVEPTSEGTGLRLIADNVCSWGVDRTAVSKTVWAELA